MNRNQPNLPSSLKQKVCQMFVVRPEALNLGVDVIDFDRIAEVGLNRLDDDMRRFCEEYPVGGVCLFAHNITNPLQIAAFTSELHQLPFRPLLCVDEEGGRVSRIAINDAFGLGRFESMEAVGSGNDPQKARDAGLYIGSYVHQAGFDVDFAPVADVNTNPDNIIIGSRAFSSDPEAAAAMVTGYLSGLNQAGVYGCVKHFPGHGDVQGDTHTGYVETRKTWDEMLECELLTFRAAIRSGVRMIMAAHISTPGVTGSDVPASMSPVVLGEKMRGELGYEGLIVTDSLEMGAITQHYTPGESAVAAVKAGADIILMPQNLRESVDAVIHAVEAGEIPELRIDESIRRIMALKALCRN